MKQIPTRCLLSVFFALILAVPGFANRQTEEMAEQIEVAAIHITDSDSAELIAYHSKLPLSAMLKVTNSANGKSVNVKVRGRLRGAPDNVLHISEEAARILGITGSGNTPVMVQAVNSVAAFEADISREDPPPAEFDVVLVAVSERDYEDYESEETPAEQVTEWSSINEILRADPETPETETPELLALAATPPESEMTEEEAPVPPVVAEPAPERPDPQPPTRTVIPDRPPPDAISPPTVSVTQTGPPESSTHLDITVTININGQDYVFETSGDGQVAPVSHPAPPRQRRRPSQSPPQAPPDTPAPVQNIQSNAVYRIQVGAFANINLARAVFNRLTSVGFTPSYEPYENMYRVVISGVKAGDVPEAARKLEAAGFSDVWLRRED